MTPAKTEKKTRTPFPSLWSDFFSNDKILRNPWFESEFGESLPSVNIRENGKEYCVEFAAPGFSKTDFNIEVEDNILNVSAEKNEDKKEENERYTRKEFSYSRFTRTFTLPENVNSGKIDASYNDGILAVHIPKKEESKTAQKKAIRVE